MSKKVLIISSSLSGVSSTQKLYEKLKKDLP